MKIVMIGFAVFWIGVGMAGFKVAEQIGWPLTLLLLMVIMVALFFGLPHQIAELENHDGR